MTVTLDQALLGPAQDESRGSGRKTLRIAVPHDSPHAESVVAAGHELVRLPEIPDTALSRSLEQRIEDGEVYRRFLTEHPVDLLLDVETSALTFVRNPSAGPHALTMTHTLFNVPYVSSFIDPVTETMQQVPWPVRWQALEHPGWIKWVADEAHASELRRLGVPNVLSLSMAAADGDYPTDPLPEHPSGAAVGFLGNPATSWFTNESASPALMRSGLIAAAAKADTPELTFERIYYDVYAMADPPHASEPAVERARKAAAYFQAKFTYNVYLAVKARDRFVLFLKRQLGEQFDLIGVSWEKCHGLSHRPPVYGREKLVDVYRSTAICLNLYKGNFETGLNVRQYEVTAAGGFLLSYVKPELAHDFDLGRECVVFRSEFDLLEKVRYYLAHPRERIEIAQAGQRRTLGEHLYSHRIHQLVERLHAAGALR